MENLAVKTVPDNSALDVLNRGMIDIQVSTAKAYPRNLMNVLQNIKLFATMDKDTAAECFYHVKRADGEIEGISVRLAEIVASCWGSLKADARVIANDGKEITAQGVC